MRMRHTSRTDPSLDGDRRQVSFRLNADYRQRMADVAESHLIPDIHTVADIMQDAMWLWFHEYDLMVEKGLFNGVERRTGSSGDHLGGATGTPGEEVPGVEVGAAP